MDSRAPRSNNYKCRRVWTNSKYRQPQRAKESEATTPEEQLEREEEKQQEPKRQQKTRECPDQEATLTKQRQEREAEQPHQKEPTDESRREATTITSVLRDQEPGPSGLQQHRIAKHMNETQQTPSGEEPTARFPAKEAAEITDRYDTIIGNTSFANCCEDVQLLLCKALIDDVLPNHTRLGTDFALAINALFISNNKKAAEVIGNIHTVAVAGDHILLLRSDNLDDALIFQWRKRSDWIAMKILAILRKRGEWQCKKLKIYETAMQTNAGTPESRDAVKAVMHFHLADLLKRFEATEEIKLTECPYFWRQRGIGCLREVTTAAQSTSTIRGIPDRTWMPSINWTVNHRLPLLLRRADAWRCTSWTEGLDLDRYISETEEDSTFASYTSSDSIPQRGHGDLWRFPSLPPLVAATTLQLCTCNLQNVHRQLSANEIPQHFQSVDIILRGLRPSATAVQEAITRIHRALIPFFFLKRLTITLQVTGYDDDDELWNIEDGTRLADYLTSLLKAAEKAEEESAPLLFEGQEEPYWTEIAMQAPLRSWIASQDTLQMGAEAIRNAFNTFAERNGYGRVTAMKGHGNSGRSVHLPWIRTMQQTSITARVDLELLRVGQNLPNINNFNIDSREAILATLERFLLRDLQEDA